MDDIPQNIYAKCLPAHRGYPLWYPEPNTSLPDSYQQDGLQIGDVGVVDQNGRFHVLFNISYNSKHALHQRYRSNLSDFPLVEFDYDADVDVISNADPPRCVITSPGIVTLLKPDADTYEFEVPSCAKGAILVLPQGAMFHDLQEKEKFRTIAEEHALEWCGIASKRYGKRMSACSLYLITGFYKAHSWCLAAFNDPASLELKNRRCLKIVRRENIDGGSTAGRCWVPTFPSHCRIGPGSNHNGVKQNQTVFISGFKIAVKEDVLGWWAPGPVVEPVPPVQVRPRSCCASLREKLFGKKHPIRCPSGTNGVGTVEHSPSLAPPFHPSDTINQFLLNKYSDALVAVTHDSQWMAMIEAGELALEDFMHEERLERLLSENYSLGVEHEHGRHAVYMKRNSNGTQVSGSKDEHQPGVHESVHDPENCWDPVPSGDKLQVVITRIRAENVAAGLRRMPVGFCVLVEFDGTQRKTRNKQVSISDQLIEWEDVIRLPSELSTKVQLSVCASFEFSPMLGRGEVLYTLEKSIEELVYNSRLIMLNEGEDTSCSSLLITTERRTLHHLEVAACGKDTNLDWEVSSELAKQTDRGHDALFRHHNEPTRENLDIAIQHFEGARKICPSGHGCRVAVLRNLAMAKFLECQISGTYASLESAISLYREALDLCHAGDPDRPGTLLYLAHTLLYRYDKQGCEESVVVEVKKLMAQVLNACCSGSHEHRAAELVLQTCRRCRVINSSSPVGLDELVSELDLASRAPPSGYFDRPQRMHNFALALLRRFELHGGLNDLERSIMIHEEAIRLAPVSHPDRPVMLARLGASYFKRYLVNVNKCISTSEATFQWSPQSHADWFWSWLFAKRSTPSPSRLKQVGDFGDLGKSIDGMEEALQFTPAGHPDRRGTLMNFSRACLWRFGQVGDHGDLEKPIAMMEEVLRSTQSSHPDWPGILMSLGHAYFWRFGGMGVLAPEGLVNIPTQNIENVTS